MGLFKFLSKLLIKSPSGSDKVIPKKEKKYVYLASSEAIFLITGKIRESRFSYGIPIVPLLGKFRSYKEGKTYDATELRGYDVVLNLPKDFEVEKVKDKRIVVLGYDRDSIYIDEDGDEKKNKRFKHMFS